MIVRVQVPEVEAVRVEVPLVQVQPVAVPFATLVIELAPPPDPPVMDVTESDPCE